MRTLFVLVASLGTAGCFAAGSLYRHPTTQETRVCAQQGVDIGVPIAIARYARCKDQLTAAGYVKDRNLTIYEVACLGWKPHPDGTCSDERVDH
jgi:hypothetical protein